MHIINYSLISSHNNQHKPPCHVDDLIEGLQDGTKLLALLEVLSGERLVCCHSWASLSAKKLAVLPAKRKWTDFQGSSSEKNRCSLEDAIF